MLLWCFHTFVIVLPLDEAFNKKITIPFSGSPAVTPDGTIPAGTVLGGIDYKITSLRTGVELSVGLEFK